MKCPRCNKELKQTPFGYMCDLDCGYSEGSRPLTKEDMKGFPTQPKEQKP